MSEYPSSSTAIRYLSQLVHVLLVRTKHPSGMLAASALSALSSLIELSKWAVLPYIEELLSCGVGLSLSEHVPVRPFRDLLLSSGRLGASAGCVCKSAVPPSTVGSASRSTCATKCGQLARGRVVLLRPEEHGAAAKRARAHRRSSACTHQQGGTRIGRRNSDACPCHIIVDFDEESW
jgi:hypothetical protein